MEATICDIFVGRTGENSGLGVIGGEVHFGRSGGGGGKELIKFPQFSPRLANQVLSTSSRNIPFRPTN